MRCGREGRLELRRYLHLDSEVASQLLDRTLNGFNGAF